MNLRLRCQTLAEAEALRAGRVRALLAPLEGRPRDAHSVSYASPSPQRLASGRTAELWLGFLLDREGSTLATAYPSGVVLVHREAGDDRIDAAPRTLDSPLGHAGDQLTLTVDSALRGALWLDYLDVGPLAGLPRHWAAALAPIACLRGHSRACAGEDWRGAHEECDKARRAQVFAAWDAAHPESPVAHGPWVWVGAVAPVGSPRTARRPATAWTPTGPALPFAPEP